MVAPQAFTPPRVVVHAADSFSEPCVHEIVVQLLNWHFGESEAVRPGGSANTTVRLASLWSEDMRRNLEEYSIKIGRIYDTSRDSPVSLVRSDVTWWRAASTSRRTSPENLVRLLVPRLLMVVYLLDSHSEDGSHP
jgi:hypothetical protein